MLLVFFYTPLEAIENQSFSGFLDDVKSDWQIWWLFDVTVAIVIYLYILIVTLRVYNHSNFDPLITSIKRNYKHFI